MDDVFEKKVRAAAVAGWWTLLIALGFLVFQWGFYLFAMCARPAWLLSLWGPGTDWPFVQTVWFWGTAILKLCLWPATLVVLWLTLWARQLRKRAGGRIRPRWQAIRLPGGDSPTRCIVRHPRPANDLAAELRPDVVQDLQRSIEPHEAGVRAGAT
jgi:hypothetical protein